MVQKNDFENDKDNKQVLTMEAIEFINGDLQQKYEELLKDPSLNESDKTKWKAVFDEFTDFYNNAPCGYHTIDDTGLIINMNETELNWLGYKRDEIVNKKNIMDLMSEKSGMLFYSEMPRLREKGCVDQLEVEYVRKDKTILQALVSSRAIYDEHKVFKCGRSTLWDITDRKKMEDEMYKVTRHLRNIKDRFTEKNTLAQKLNEELLAAKKSETELFNEIGENIIKPLNKLALQCQTLSDAPPAGTNLRTNLSEIRDSIKDVSSFVNQAVLQQRVFSGNNITQLSSFNLSSLLITVVNRLEEQADRKKITINCEIFEDVWVESDKEVLAQVFDTLLATVIKLTLPGKEIPLRLIRKVNECLVELEINGLNISTKDFSGIFDKKLPSPESAKNSDMELNSHLVNSLLENLGYELTVNPVTNKGTLIRICIPLK